MTNVITLCSANYLAHARTLGDSLKEHNPEVHFVIGLVDHLPAGYEPSWAGHYELIPVEDLGIPDFAEMVERYDVVELNTAVKPFYIEHLYNRNAEVQAVIYFDPDIMVCGSLNTLLEKLRDHNLIVTPHSCTFDDSDMVIYYETGMLSTGIYNLGFLATRRSEITFKCLRWWQRRLREYCYYQPGSGLFVDQLWMTLAPLYFPGVYVEKDPGYNMCYWNHFERRLTRRDNRYVVNDVHELIFYHFSSYSIEKPDLITKRVQSKVSSFSERPDLRAIYDEYRNRLMAAGYHAVKGVRYALRNSSRKSPRGTKAVVKHALRAALRALPSSCRRFLDAGARFTLNTFK